MAAGPNYCHIGLGVNALHCVKVLRRNQVKADLFGIVRPLGMIPHLLDNPTCTHAVIQAPWVDIPDLQKILQQFPQVHFVIRVHSQIAFLQVEPGAIKLIREYQSIVEGTLNLTLSCNNERFQYFWDGAYQAQILYLPNLYDLMPAPLSRWRPPSSKDTLRISSFGALRLMKNHTTSAATAMLIAQRLGTKLEFAISVNREEHGGRSILQSLRNMFSGLKWATLVENAWESWSDFRRTVSTMDLGLQLSMSETFNITTADGASMGIPSVVAECVEWVPHDWQAPIDEVEESARVGLWLLHDQDAGKRGLAALTKYNDTSIKTWLDYLTSNPT